MVGVRIRVKDRIRVRVRIRIRVSVRVTVTPGNRTARKAACPHPRAPSAGRLKDEAANRKETEKNEGIRGQRAGKDHR